VENYSGSSDISVWTTIGDSKFGEDQIYAIAWGSDKFVSGGEKGKITYSSDGENWTAVTDSKFGSRYYITAVTYGNGKFIAAGINHKTGDGKMAYRSASRKNQTEMG